jgi:hypothetical protein
MIGKLRFYNFKIFLDVHLYFFVRNLFELSITTQTFVIIFFSQKIQDFKLFKKRIIKEL